MPRFERFGNQIPFCEPSWYQGHHTPYYTEGHAQFRKVVRDFVEKEIKPNREKWIKTGYPKELHELAYEKGLGGIIYPKEFGGQRPDNYDAFYEIIMIDEVIFFFFLTYLLSLFVPFLAFLPFFPFSFPLSDGKNWRWGSVSTKQY